MCPAHRGIKESEINKQLQAYYTAVNESVLFNTLYDMARTATIDV